MSKLSHILPPGGHPSKSATLPVTQETCPRAIIGAVPAGTPLHLAIAHQLEDQLQHQQQQRDTQEEFGVDDLTIPVPVTATLSPDRNGE